MRVLLPLLLAFCVFSAEGFETKRLFTLSGTPAASADKSSVASVRESPVVFGSGSLRDAGVLQIELFDGVVREAFLAGIENRALDDYTWRGKLVDGNTENDVVLTFRKGFVSGLIQTASAAYEIVPRGDRHLLVELDGARFPECGGGLRSDDGPPPQREAVASVDSGDRIDVLVVYTTATKNFLGGDAQAQTLSQQAVDATNTAYSNSRVNQRIRMVRAQEWVYTESGSGSTDLSNLRNSAEIQSLRNTWNADLVAMIGEVTGVCGVGYLMGSNTAAGNPNNGFTVTARSCAVGNLTFAHELGHNMGSQHNPENGSGATYAFGYGHYINGNYRTVMSYSDPCTSGCTRRPYFSNPNIVFGGVATGIEGARDNARSLNLTADPIANYRYSGSSITLSNFNGEILPRGVARTVAWTSHNVAGDVRIELSRDEGVSWTTLRASTPNDGAEPVVVWGPATKRARIRVTGISSPTVSDTSTRNVMIR